MLEELALLRARKILSEFKGAEGLIVRGQLETGRRRLRSAIMLFEDSLGEAQRMLAARRPRV